MPINAKNKVLLERLCEDIKTINTTDDHRSWEKAVQQEVEAFRCRTRVALLRRLHREIADSPHTEVIISVITLQGLQNL